MQHWVMGSDRSNGLHEHRDTSVAFQPTVSMTVCYFKIQVKEHIQFKSQ